MWPPTSRNINATNNCPNGSGMNILRIVIYALSIYKLYNYVATCAISMESRLQL